MKTFWSSLVFFIAAFLGTHCSVASEDELSFLPKSYAKPNTINTCAATLHVASSKDNQTFVMQSDSFFKVEPECFWIEFKDPSNAATFGFCTKDIQKGIYTFNPSPTYPLNECYLCYQNICNHLGWNPMAGSVNFTNTAILPSQSNIHWRWGSFSGSVFETNHPDQILTLSGTFMCQNDLSVYSK